MWDIKCIVQEFKTKFIFLWLNFFHLSDCLLGTINQQVYLQLFHTQIPQVQKGSQVKSSQCLFALSGSVFAKNARKMLVELTPGLLFFISLGDKSIKISDEIITQLFRTNRERHRWLCDGLVELSWQFTTHYMSYT